METNGITLLEKANGKQNKRFAKTLELEYENLLIPEGISNVIPILNELNTKIPILKIIKQPINVISKNE